MGRDLVAYLDIDQRAVDDIIRDGAFDKNKWDDAQRIADTYAEKYVPDPVRLNYTYNERCDMHEIDTSWSTGFLRCDDRFVNRRCHRLLEERVGQPFPGILHDIDWSVRTRADAIESADGLETFFADDEPMIKFARWLRLSAKYCTTYELSY
jgi:hypothetical protein